jgi:antitoxin component of MazEF toxin-antitoxin module
MPKPVTVTRNGNASVVTIPKDILTKLGWRRRDVLLLSIRGDALLVQRMNPPDPLVSVPDEKPAGVGR